MKYLRHILLTLFIAITMTLSAQCDAFFTEYDTQYENRDAGATVSSTMTPTNFGPVDLNGGLILLTIGGIVYILYKRRKMGLVMLLCLTLVCCKKQDTVVVTRPTADVHLCSQCSKTNISPTGAVTWSSNDVLHVYSNTVGYLGQMSYSGNNTFDGTIYQWADGDTLTFYYLGQNTPVEATPLRIDYSTQVNTSLSDIAKQYHVSKYTIGNVPDDVRQFSGQMQNMMSIMYLNTQSFQNETVKMLSDNGLYNMIEIDAFGHFRYSVAGINTSCDNPSGHITLGRGTQTKYVAVLPGNGLSLTFVSNTRQSVGQLNVDIPVSDFICNGSVNVPIVISATEYHDSRYIDYTIDTDETHKFTINSDKSPYKKIVFSKGNLVYNCGRFKQHCNDYNVISNSDYHVTSDIDRFGWMTSSYNYKNLLFQPYTTSNVVSSKYKKYNGYGYGPYNGTSYEQSCYPGQNGTLSFRKCDWGWNQFSMNVYEQTSDGRYWRVLGNLEWEYMFDASKRNRSLNGDGITPLFGYCRMDTLNGCLLLPDEWQDGYFTNQFIYGSTTFTDNVITSSDLDALELHGAVFLPVSGYRNGRNVVNTSIGYYWGCKHSSNTSAGCLVIRQGEVPHIEAMTRPTGAFVRLVYQTDGAIW